MKKKKVRKIPDVMPNCFELSDNWYGTDDVWDWEWDKLLKGVPNGLRRVSKNRKVK